MAMEPKVLDIAFKARDEASPVVEKLAAEVKLLKREVAEAAEEEGQLDRLKNAFGRRSEFTHALHLLEASGPIIGLGLAARLLREAAEHAAELRKELHEGKITTGEFVEKLITGIPVFGHFWAAGRAIRELITGEEAAAAQIKEDAEAGVKFMEARLALQRQTLKEAKEHVEVMRRLREEEALVGLRGPAREGLELAFKAEERQREIERKQEEKAKEFRESALKEQEEAQKRVAAAEKEVERVKNRKQPTYQSAEGFNPQIESDAVSAALKEAESTLAARREELQKTGRRMQEGLAKIEREGQQERALAADLAARQQYAAAEEAAHQHEEKVRKAEEETEDVRASARRNALRAAGHDLQAEIEQLREHFRKRKSEVDRGLQEELKGISPDARADRAAARRRAAERVEALVGELETGIAAAAAKDRERREEKAKQADERRLAIEKELGRLGFDFRREQLELQGKGGELELKRLEIAEKYRQAHERIAEILRDENATQEQKNAAAAAGNALIEQEKAALAKAKADAARPAEVPGLVEGRHLTGLGARTRDDLVLQAAREQTSETKEVRKSMQRAEKFFEKMSADIAELVRRGQSGGGVRIGVF